MNYTGFDFMKTLLTRGFIRPFTNLSLYPTYLGTFFGGIGFAGLFAYLAYDYAQLGLIPLLVFFLARFSFSGFILNPAAYYGFYKLKRTTACGLMLVAQAGALAILCVYPQLIAGQGDDAISLIIAALLISLISFPFWVLFHVNMITHTSDSNVGNEVSITDILYFSGSTLSIIGSGFFLTFAPGFTFILLCGIALLAGSLCLTLAGKKDDMSVIRDKPFNMLQSFRDNKAQLTGTTSEGMFQFLTSFFVPVWLWAIGVSGVMMGFMMALKGALKFVSSPVAGHLFHQKRGRDLIIGAALKPLGWIPWLLLQSPWMMLVSGFFWTLGAQLFSTGLNSRWYQGRCLSAQAIREMALATGRCIMAVITMPILYILGAHSFFIAAMAFTALTLVAAFIIRKSEQTHAQAHN